MVEGWGRGEREAFAEDGSFRGSEGVRRQVHDRSGGSVGILGRLKFLRKFRRGVRGSGKVEVVARDGLSIIRGGEVARGWRKGRLPPPLRKLMRRFESLLSFFLARRSSDHCAESSVLWAAGRRWGCC